MTSVVDVDGDGRLDLVNASSAANLVWRGCGDGTFETTAVSSPGTFMISSFPSLPIVTVHSIAVADFNGDGRADVAVAGGDGSTPFVYVGVAAGQPDGTFVAPVSLGGFALPSMANPTSALAFVGDLDGDGVTDLLFQTGWYDPNLNRCVKLVSLLGVVGSAGFRVAAGTTDTDCPARKGKAGLASVGKILGDGHVNASLGEVYQSFTGTPMPRFPVFDGSGDGSFTAPPVGTAAPDIQMLDGYLEVHWRDLDGDGRDDAVAISDGTHATQIFWNDGAPSFSAGPLYLGLHPGDFDHDGKVDIVNGDSSSATILFGDGTRGFGRALAVPSPFVASNAIVVDVDRDGVDDLVDSADASIYLSTAKHPVTGAPDVCSGCVGPTGF